jgi:hypothetical protein
MKPGTMIHGIIEKIIQFFQETKNQDRVRKYCVDPILTYVTTNAFPYMLFACILIGLLLLFSITNVILLVFLLRHISALEPSKI